MDTIIILMNGIFLGWYFTKPGEDKEKRKKELKVSIIMLVGFLLIIYLSLPIWTFFAYSFLVWIYGVTFLID